MNNQEAAEMIRDDMKLHHNYLSGTYRKALNMAISALQAQEELYVDSKCKTCRYYHDYDDVRCMICDDENDMYEEQEVKKSGCTYKPDCPWYDGSKCNSPNDPGYHECDYDRGILPEDDSDELDEVMQHWIKQADEQEKVAEMYPEYVDECEKISNDFRQLASWLKELKRLRTEVYFLKAERENTPVDLLGDVPCKTCRWKAETTEKCEECIDGITDNYEVQIECEDCVSRQAAIDAIVNWAESHHENPDGDDCIMIILDVPPAQPDGWLEQNKDKILQAGMEGREIDFRIGGRLFAIREKAQ